MPISSFIFRLICSALAFAGQLISPAPVQKQQRAWAGAFAWFPVLPSDERDFFWLEAIWRRRHPVTMRWEYRSFRTDTAKLREAASLADRPPLIH
ncbi:hypothetical protein CO731_04714 [Aminobacter sp. MSH1]|uniref:hypothetical protein n=1 Tax=Aminobacter sp. MSH1 TaxID=374606 RepID=UPI000D50526B|nr:hypothetical protein [Aminobacter sp. MSH1]AWC25220.1 hypothetical protein CO731_04714 [Aminobacter sp. MSH1]